MTRLEECRGHVPRGTLLQFLNGLTQQAGSQFPERVPLPHSWNCAYGQILCPVPMAIPRIFPLHIGRGSLSLCSELWRVLLNSGLGMGMESSQSEPLTSNSGLQPHTIHCVEPPRSWCPVPLYPLAPCRRPPLSQPPSRGPHPTVGRRRQLACVDCTGYHRVSSSTP